uniref:Peptidase M12B domain-containing protein n=1 Tax=Strigamia maritima TaxID=126957 RepID=T1IZL7_STRMM
MALPNLLVFVFCSLLVFYNTRYAYVHTKALNEFINYYEPVFFDAIPNWEFGHHDFIVAEGADSPNIAKDVRIRLAYDEQVDIRAFGRIFRLELNRSTSILSADADITVMGGKESCNTEKVDPKTILSNLVEGRVVEEPLSFVHGVLIKGVFTGVIHLSNQTLFVERASKYFRDRMPFDCVIFRQEDLNMTAVDCEVGPDGYKCDPIRLLHRRGPGVEQVLSLAHSERSWFKGRMVPKTTCTLKVIADHLFTKYAGDGSATNAIYEMIFHVQEADHIYRKTDFDQDGQEDNVGFKIQEVLVQSSTTCLENRAFMKPKLTSDQYLEIFSEYDFENYCVGIAFSGYTFPGRILGIAWMADADESGYVGGICEPRLFSTQDQKALSFNSAVITMMLQGRRMPRGITAIAVAHELGHSFGSDHDPHPDDRCSPTDNDGGRFIMAAVAVKGDQPNNRYFSPCSIGHMKTVLRKKGNCFISLARSLCCNYIKFG